MIYPIYAKHKKNKTGERAGTLSLSRPPAIQKPQADIEQ
jgi:hypothetical protein